LDADGAGLTSTDGEEMDMTAERWARELMTRELSLERPQ